MLLLLAVVVSVERPRKNATLRPPRVVLLPLPVAWICTILIGNNSRRMRLQLFLVASRGGMILEMGQTRVQKSVYFSFGNGNDLVSGMWSSELVVN